MKRFAIFTLVALLCSMFGFAERTGRLEAFPGAEGYGRYTSGGRGGKVYKVTKLDDDGSEGTFRWACEQKGPRTIVFEVSGTIHLNSVLDLKNGDVTIAGQTAPGDGICIADYPFQLRANNIILRFMRFRLGNKNATVGGADGWDALGSLEGKYIIVDHCSISWSLDECLSFSGVENTTVQWCIVANSLVHSGHSKGNHGYGGNWGGKKASYHHNLMANHTSRAPRLGPRPNTQLEEHMDMRNNVLFNYSGEGCYGGEGMNVNIVNNYYKPGPGNKYVDGSDNKKYRIAGIGVRNEKYVETYPDYLPALHLVGSYYVDGNKNYNFAAVLKDNWGMGMYNQITWSNWDDMASTAAKQEALKAQIKRDAPIDFEYTTTHSVDDTYLRIYDYVGACRFETANSRYVTRDAYDTAILDDMAANKSSLGTGDEYSGDNPTGKKMGSGFINTVDDITYPTKYKAGTDYEATTKLPILKSTAALKDTDGDGMPDEWETKNGLNPNDPSDGAERAASGYTNLEVYMNSLVQKIMDGGNTGGKLLTGDLTYADAAVTAPVFDLSLYDPNEDPQNMKWNTPVDPGLGENTWLIASTTTPSVKDDLWPITFQDAVVVSCSDSGRKYQPGSSKTKEYVKFSAKNHVWTFKLPEGKVATDVTIRGWANVDGNTSYVQSFNGENYSATQYVFPSRLEASEAEYNFKLSNPANQFTVVFGANESVLKLEINGADAGESGIEDIVVDPAQPQGNGKIYNIMGVEVKEPLLPGIYIRDGKKFLVK